MSKQARWLSGEIDRWTGERIITDEQAARIRALYPISAVPSVPWGLIVFFSIGAIVIGLGVILLLAYNWDALPKFARLGLIFGATAAAHAGGIALRGRPDWRAMLGEGFCLLGTMLFGAGIWLVAQIYHIDEHFPTGFLVWGLGALAMAWALGSVPQALLATATFMFWGGFETIEYDRSVDFAMLLIVVGVGGLVWRLRSTVLMGGALAALYFHLLTNAVSWGGGEVAFMTMIAFSVLILGAERLCEDAWLPSRARGVMRFFGLTGFLLCSYILTFGGFADGIARRAAGSGDVPLGAFAYHWGTFGIAALAWGTVVARAAASRWSGMSLDDWFYPLGLVTVYLVRLIGAPAGEWLLMLVFNLVLLGVSTMWILHGCREGRLRKVVLGSVLFALLVFARYFDLFDSLAARGFAFLLLGGILFAEGFYYRKLRADEAAGREVAS